MNTTTLPTVVTSMKIVDCPNPDCDGGCCLCEHTGKVYEYVIERDEQEQTMFARMGEKIA